MAQILGGGNNGAAAAAAAQQRKLQQVANDRQLAASAEADQRAGTMRKNPRGRRLFVADASQKADLS
jgi:hypothetical protein